MENPDDAGTPNNDKNPKNMLRHFFNSDASNREFIVNSWLYFKPGRRIIWLV